MSSENSSGSGSAGREDPQDMAVFLVLAGAIASITLGFGVEDVLGKSVDAVGGERDVLV